MLNKSRIQQAMACKERAKRTLFSVVIVLAGMSTMAHAEEATDPGKDSPKMFTFRGFGSFGVTHSSLKTADYTANIFQPKGAGASTGYSLTNLTKIGAQLNAQFTDC